MFFPSFTKPGKVIIKPAAQRSSITQAQPSSHTFSRARVPAHVLQENDPTTVTLTRPTRPARIPTQPPQPSSTEHTEPLNPPVPALSYPMRPSSREQDFHHAQPLHGSSSNSNSTYKYSYSGRSTVEQRKRLKNIEKQNRRRDVYKLHAQDGRVKQLAAAKGNAYNARPQPNNYSPRSRDTWVPSKLPSSSTYQAPRSTTMDTAFTSAAGSTMLSGHHNRSIVSGTSGASGSSGTNGSGGSKKQHRATGAVRDPRRRRPFKDMVEVQTLAEHQQALRQTCILQIENDANVLMSIGMRRNDAMSWANEMDAELRVALRHLEIICCHRSRDLIQLQIILEERKRESSLSALSALSGLSSSASASFMCEEHECREMARSEREVDVLLDINSKMRQESTHGMNDGSDLEDYTPLLVIDVQKLLENQREKIFHCLRALSIDQRASGERRRKWSAFRIQRQWRRFYLNKMNVCAVLIQQQWARYMCAVLNMRVTTNDNIEKNSIQIIQRCWKLHVTMKKSYSNKMCPLWLCWLNKMIVNNEYGDQYDYEVGRSCLKIQTAWRCSRAALFVHHVRSLKNIQKRCSRRKRWEKRRGGGGGGGRGRSARNRRDLYLAHRKLVMWHVHLTSEKEHVRREIEKEHRMMARAWQR